MKKTILIGAGGHAKVVYDVLHKKNKAISGFIDPSVNEFYALSKLSDDVIDFSQITLSMCLGGVDPQALQRRFKLFRQYQKKSANFLSVISDHSIVSNNAKIDEGVFVNNGAVLNGPCEIQALAIINTRAIIEHDVIVGAGTHIAPGAIVLGNCQIGKNCMIGAGAVILPDTTIPDNSLIPSLTRFPKT